MKIKRLEDGSPAECKICKSDLQYEHNGLQYSRIVGIEDPNLYDGVSYWKCPDCSGVWSRFTGKVLFERNRL